MTDDGRDPITCPECGRDDFQTRAGLARHRTQKHDPEPLAANVAAAVNGAGTLDDQPPASDNGTPAGPEPLHVVGEGNAEIRPQARPAPKQASIFDKLRTKSKDGGPAEPAEERRPAKPAPRRVSTQEFWGGVVEFAAGGVLKVDPNLVPLSRAMVWTTPVAGEIIEDTTKGTLIDKGIQPLVRNGEKWQDLGDLLGFWVAIGIANTQPEKAQMALGFARKRLVNLLPKIASNIAKQRKKEKAAAEAIATLMPDLGDLGLGDSGDPVGDLIAMLFSAPDAPQPQPEPETVA